jgi:hypothetical protein
VAVKTNFNQSKTKQLLGRIYLPVSDDEEGVGSLSVVDEVADEKRLLVFGNDAA